MFAKRDFWEREFANAVPLMIALWFVEDNRGTLETMLNDLEPEEVIRFTEGGASGEDIANFFIAKCDLHDICLARYKTGAEMCSTSLEMRLLQCLKFCVLTPHSKFDLAIVNWDPNHKLFQTASIGSVCRELLDELRQVLGKFIMKSEWWKRSQKEIRSGARKVSTVKRVMTS